MTAPQAKPASDMEDGDFASYLTFKLDLLKSQMIDGANIIYRRELGLDVRSLRVLRTICDTPGATATAVRERTLIEKTLLSKVLGDLIERGLVRRTIDREDARQYQLRPTANGTRVRLRSDQIGKAVEEEMLSVLSAEERERLNRIVDKLITELRGAARGRKKAEGGSSRRPRQKTAQT